MSETAIDPISAIANAAGDLFNSVGSIWTSISSVKIAKQQTRQLSELTVQERIKYDELISSGNFALASDLLQQKSSKINAENQAVYIILGATFLIVLVVVYLKIKKK